MTTDQDSLIQKLDYDDHFVSINGANSTLTLKHYFLFKPTLAVHIPSLLYIRPASEVVSRIGIEPEGLSITGILWARDWHRGTWLTGPGSGFKKSFVIKVRGDKLRSGFSVENPETFLAVLERVCPGVTKTAMSVRNEAAVDDHRSSSRNGGSEIRHPSTPASS